MFYHNHGKCPHAELIYHDILSFHRLQRVGKITENIIVYPRHTHSDRRRNDEQNTDDKYDIFVSRNKFAKPIHTYSLLF